MLNKESIDCVENFENYYEYVADEELKKIYTKEEIGYIWFCNLFAIFYDNDMELKWGKMLYETTIAILERKQDILLNKNYEEYLLCLNLIGIENLEWGTSIRFCWFKNEEIKNKFKNYLKQLGYKKGNKK